MPSPTSAVIETSSQPLWSSLIEFDLFVGGIPVEILVVALWQALDDRPACQSLPRYLIHDDVGP
jgi:hypothetical protein